jgi:hypothetical protein
MFSAGALIWIEAQVPHVDSRWSQFEIEGGGFRLLDYGFPMTAVSKREGSVPDGLPDGPFYQPIGIVVDLLFALVALGVVAVISEHFIRRREGREK